MSLLYWLSKFSQEAMLVELFLIACVTAAYFGYLLIQKRRYGVAKKQIPDNVVRAFLIELISSAEGFKNQLFGEEFKIALGKNANLSNALQGASAAIGADLEGLKNQLLSALAKQEELSKIIATLNAEKAQLQTKLAAAPAAAPEAAASAAANGADAKALAAANEKITKLESKLAEYEVIEDDLANLKKFQQENKHLKAQLEALQKGGAMPAEAAPAEAAPAEEASPLAAAEDAATETKAAENFEGLVDKVEESLAAPSGASAVDPLAAADAMTAAPASDASAPAAPEAPAAAAPLGEPKSEKSDADLLNEFERMLSS